MASRTGHRVRLDVALAEVHLFDVTDNFHAAIRLGQLIVNATVLQEHAGSKRSQGLARHCDSSRASEMAIGAHRLAGLTRQATWIDDRQIFQRVRAA